MTPDGDRAMAFYLVTPQPILVEANSASEAVAKAQKAFVGGKPIRYEVKTPSEETLWVTSIAEPEDDAPVADAPVSTALPVTCNGVEPHAVSAGGLFGRLLRGIWQRN